MPDKENEAQRLNPLSEVTQHTVDRERILFQICLILNCALSHHTSLKPKTVEPKGNFRTSSSISLPWQFTDVATAKAIICPELDPEAESPASQLDALSLVLLDFPYGIVLPNYVCSNYVSLWLSAVQPSSTTLGLGRAIEECDVGSPSHFCPPHPHG